MALEFILFYIVLNIHHVHEIITCWDRLTHNTHLRSMLLVPTQHKNLPTQASHCMAKLRRDRCKKTVFQKNRKYVLSSAESPERIQCSPKSTMQWNVRWSWIDCYVHDCENRDTDCSTGAGSVVVGYRYLTSAWPLSGQSLHCFPVLPADLRTRFNSSAATSKSVHPPSGLHPPWQVPAAVLFFPPV